MNDVDPTGFFEPLYVAAARGERTVPWDRGGPHPLIAGWARDLRGAGRRALVVGSGLGADAELFAERGFAVVAFDVSPTAVASTRERYPGSPVDPCVADLLDPPADWQRAFDLVVESLTVQSMPIELHARATCERVADGGPGRNAARRRDRARRRRRRSRRAALAAHPRRDRGVRRRRRRAGRDRERPRAGRAPALESGVRRRAV